jgi:hypothetical protein
MRVPLSAAEKERSRYLHLKFLKSCVGCLQAKWMRIQNISESTYDISIPTALSQAVESLLIRRSAMRRGLAYIHFEHKEHCIIEWMIWYLVVKDLGIYSSTSMIRMKH